MKKNILLCVLVAIASFDAGYLANQKAGNTPEDYEFLQEANDFKSELIEAQHAALEQAEKVMDNNGLWDIDGSDDMADYMDLYARVDSLLRAQR